MLMRTISPEKKKSLKDASAYADFGSMERIWSPQRRCNGGERPRSYRATACGFEVSFPV